MKAKCLKNINETANQLFGSSFGVCWMYTVPMGKFKHNFDIIQI